MTRYDLLQKIKKGAEAHAENSGELEQQTIDLEEIIALAISAMPEAQFKQFSEDPIVQTVIKGGDPSTP